MRDYATRTPSREEIASYVSRWLHIPRETLTEDGYVFGSSRAIGVAQICHITFDKEVVVNSPGTFTFGELVRQLTSSPRRR
ncbi:MAG: hypothetical protein UX71_C0005G0077 [Parcubacteria group bacterium GW2011_GWA1_47_10]|uniref:Uncharacterized protein n=1 Tax=Candidatus Zambryskibacteria bacterium RIFCSPHIGHO2_01_FULL_46_25 TaxID=1802738 RepID=A0A1G2T0Y3_9BACT|nr:MAG: hypothetical protein UX71_C0005G0077 [Parcubacteria group bacterium GW2011_GWA1_47_10]OHA90281.1 MAG: hypothetical protein A2838_01595 [Candidatus Zambryskibacteria bacterium RIFCSPHIGHO2_01_FULL_46_25]